MIGLPLISWSLLALFFFVGLPDAIQSLDTDDWISHQAKVIESEIKWSKRISARHAHFNQYLSFEYQYQYQDEVFRSRAVAFGAISDKEEIAFAEANPVGSTIQIYFDPQDPSDSTVLLGFASDNYWGIVFFVMAVTSTVASFWWFHRKLWNKPMNLRSVNKDNFGEITA